MDLPQRRGTAARGVSLLIGGAVSGSRKEKMSNPPLLIRLFGPPEFRVNGEPLPRLKTRKGLYILALLALRHNREVERNWLAGTLWPESDELVGLTYLRQSLTDLRTALGAAADLLLSPSRKTLRLDLSTADVDFMDFGRCLQRDNPESLEQAVRLYRGPLLEGWTEEWLIQERESCAQAYLGALETLAHRTKEGTGSSAAIRYLRLIVAADPLRESAYRSLMRALAATRDFSAVTQTYRDLRATLRREVNTEPDSETQALFAQLRTDARRQAAGTGASDNEEASEARPAASPVPVESATRAAFLVPRPLSEFIGRVREVETVKQVLGSSRLVTLTGIGGVGKTRLAIRVAEEVADEFPDGVRFVDLSSLDNPALVAQKAAHTLGVPEQPGQDLLETFRARLADRQLLLILDNCEHLTEACARFAATLLQACPNVRILATSRQRLGIAGETVRPVPPLALPDQAVLHEEDKNAASALIEYEAVRLFVDRAQRVQPNLHLNPQTLRSIAVLCRRLEGIPLALELAAARMTTLEPEQILVRLKERFRLLSRGDRDAPTRLRTLRAALDWSFDLLRPEEQTLLLRLSVFSGGWALEAAEAICGAPADDGSPGPEVWEIVDCLTELADHSLIVVESDQGQARYRLLETMREYGQERLRDISTTEPLRLRARHRDYYLQFVLDAVTLLGGPDQALWLDRMERDHDNIRAALDGCLDEGTPEALRIGLQISGSLVRFWTQRSHVGEGRQRYATFLSQVPAELESTPEHGRALLGAGILAKNQSDFVAARDLLQRARVTHQQTGDRRAQGTSFHVLGDIASLLGDYPEARNLLEQGLALYREVGHRPGEAGILISLGNVVANLGDFAEASVLSERALVINQEIGDRTVETTILNGLGVLASLQNQLPQAQKWYEQALIRNRELGNVSQMALNYYNLASTAEKMGDFAQAEEDYRQALLLNHEHGKSHDKRKMVYILRGVASIAQKRNQPVRSARLFGASEAQREILGIQLDSDELAENDRLTTTLQQALGHERFDALWKEGRAFTADQAQQLALHD